MNYSNGKIYNILKWKVSKEGQVFFSEIINDFIRYKKEDIFVEFIFTDKSNFKKELFTRNRYKTLNYEKGIYKNVEENSYIYIKEDYKQLIGSLEDAFREYGFNYTEDKLFSEKMDNLGESITLSIDNIYK